MNVYDSLIEGAQELPASERGQLYTAVLEYLYFQREPDFQMKPAPKAVFVSFRPILDNQLSAAKRGKRGGRPPKKESQTKAEVSENEKLTESSGFEKPKAEVSEKPAFSKSEQEQEQEYKETLPKGSAKKAPPSLAEVEAYIEEKGIGAYVTAEEFVGYYGSQGWVKANGKPLTNWKQAVSGWASREKRQRSQQQGGGVDYGDWDF